MIEAVKLTPNPVYTKSTVKIEVTLAVHAYYEVFTHGQLETNRQQDMESVYEQR